MKTILILKGLPASGKSSFANQLVQDNPGKYKRLNKDELRAMLDASHHTAHNEKFVERVRDLILLEALKEGKHVIVDDTNLSERPVERIRQLVHTYCKDSGDQVQIEIKTMDTSLEECLERDAKREKQVGRHTILRMYKQHILGDERGPHYKEQDDSLTRAVICDLDGTLAILKGRNPYDALSCGKDLLNTPVANLLTLFRNTGAKILLMSGREELARQATINWLNQHDIAFDALWMRASGDARKDSVVKKELYETHVQHQFYVQYVLDDRDQVVDLWRLELGLPCLQVNYGDF
jgi:predicted kinase